MPLLEVYLDDELKDTIAVIGEKLTIGRSNENQLPLRGPRVQARHAELELTPEGANLTDLGSDGGTLVNGVTLRERAPYALTDGAKITIGVYTLIYRATQSDVPPSRLPPQQASAASVPPKITTPEEEAFVPPPPPRPTLPLPYAEGQASRYLYDLPALYHANDFLGRYLQIFETIWEPMEQRQDHIAMYFDPRTCPEPFIRWLASWMDFAIDPFWPEQRRRRLAAEVFDLYRWRGTSYGLERLIEICTGLAVVVEPLQPFVVRVRLKLPRDRAAERELIEDLIRTHKPAHVGYVLDIELVEPATHSATQEQS